MRKYMMFLIPALLVGCGSEAPTPDPQPPVDTTVTTPPTDTLMPPKDTLVRPPKKLPKRGDTVPVLP